MRTITKHIRVTSEQHTAIQNMAAACNMTVSSYALTRAYGYKVRLALSKEEVALLEKLAVPISHFYHFNNALGAVHQDTIRDIKANFPEAIKTIRKVGKAIEIINKFSRRVKTDNSFPSNFITPDPILKWVKEQFNISEKKFNDYDLPLFYFYKKFGDDTISKLDTLWLRMVRTSGVDHVHFFDEVRKLSGYNPVKILTKSRAHRTAEARSEIIKVVASPGQWHHIIADANSAHMNLSEFVISQCCEVSPESRLSADEVVVLRNFRLPATNVDSYSNWLIGKSQDDRKKQFNRLAFIVGWAAELDKILPALYPFFQTQKQK